MHKGSYILCVEQKELVSFESNTEIVIYGNQGSFWCEKFVGVEILFRNKGTFARVKTLVDLY